MQKTHFFVVECIQLCNWLNIPFPNIITMLFKKKKSSAIMNINIFFFKQIDPRSCSFAPRLSNSRLFALRERCFHLMTSTGTCLRQEWVCSKTRYLIKRSTSRLNICSWNNSLPFKKSDIFLLGYLVLEKSNWSLWWRIYSSNIHFLFFFSTWFYFWSVFMRDVAGVFCSFVSRRFDWKVLRKSVLLVAVKPHAVIMSRDI